MYQTTGTSVYIEKGWKSTAQRVVWTGTSTKRVDWNDLDKLNVTVMHTELYDDGGRWLDRDGVKEDMEFCLDKKGWTPISLYNSHIFSFSGSSIPAILLYDFLGQLSLLYHHNQYTSPSNYCCLVCFFLSAVNVIDSQQHHLLQSDDRSLTDHRQMHANLANGCIIDGSTRGRPKQKLVGL